MLRHAATAMLVAMAGACTPAQRPALEIHFPQAAKASAESDAALLTGVLHVEASCLTVGEENWLIVWPATARLESGEPIRVSNAADGATVAVGETIAVAGGEAAGGKLMASDLKAPLPTDCGNKVWVAGPFKRAQ